MINKISLLLSDGIGVKLNSSDDEKAVYAYSIEVLLSLFVNLMLLLFVAHIVNKKWELLIFIIFFSGLRTYAGGYHAKTHVECIALSMLGFVTSALCGVYLRAYGEIVLIFGLLFSLFMVFKLAPVESENKPLSKSERKKYKMISRASVVVLSFAAIILYILRMKTDYIYVTASAAMVIESVSLLKK